MDSEYRHFIDEHFWGFGGMLILALLENSKGLLCKYQPDLVFSFKMRKSSTSRFLLVSQVYDLRILMILELHCDRLRFFFFFFVEGGEGHN